ncbi:MAG TPA: hypothetical protein VML57_07015 [Burkholderiales bacterium]|jgi:hypothetical protein|nr:hypothetical protein [Burkholderiales bacterium]
MNDRHQPEGVPVYDPRGVVGGEAKPTAARISGLDGLRLGILDNTKWNANKLLRQIRDELQLAHKFKTVAYYRKESFSRFAAAELIEQIRAENDIVVTAIGD